MALLLAFLCWICPVGARSVSASFLNDDVTTEIRRVSFAYRSDGEGLVIRFHANKPVEAYSEPQLDDTHKLEFIVFNAALSNSYRTDQPHDPIVDLIVDAKNGHLVFNFVFDEQSSIQASAYPDQASNDLLIGVTYLEGYNHASESFLADRGQKLPEAKDESKSKAREAAVEAVEAKPVESAPVAVASHEVPVISPAPVDSDKAAKWTLDTVVIDAGHGGHDSGAMANGVKEKDVNLNVALKLGYYLEKFLKLNVVYTRTEDEFVELEQRGHIANEEGAKLFISIHSNSAPYSRTVRGTETYILGLHKTEKALEVMERENSVVRLEADPTKYSAFDQNSIMRTLAFSANLRMSEKLAALIEQQFTERARRQSRGVKQAGLIVLWAASMPAVLVELGYLTNRFEAAYLNSEEGQDYLASAIFRAVRDFKLEYDKGLESESNRVSVIETEN